MNHRHRQRLPQALVQRSGGNLSLVRRHRDWRPGRIGAEPTVGQASTSAPLDSAGGQRQPIGKFAGLSGETDPPESPGGGPARRRASGSDAGRSCGVGMQRLLKAARTYAVLYDAAGGT